MEPRAQAPVQQCTNWQSSDEVRIHGDEKEPMLTYSK